MISTPLLVDLIVYLLVRCDLFGFVVDTCEFVNGFNWLVLGDLVLLGGYEVLF